MKFRWVQLCTLSIAMIWLLLAILFGTGAQSEKETLRQFASGEFDKSFWMEYSLYHGAFFLFIVVGFIAILDRTQGTSQGLLPFDKVLFRI